MGQGATITRERAKVSASTSRFVGALAPTAFTWHPASSHSPRIGGSEAVVAEATDYVVYFCGLDCYDRWRHQREALPSDSPVTSQR